MKKCSKALAVVPFIIATCITQGLLAGTASKVGAVVVAVATFCGVYSAPANADG